MPERSQRWVMHGMFALVSGLVGCDAGELDERQENYLRRQLNAHYPQEESGDTNSTATSQPQTPAPSSSPAADTSSPADSTADGTGVDSQGISSEPTSGNPNADLVPACAVEIFRTTCSGSLCHSQGAVNLPPDFDSNDLYTLLTTTKSAICPSAPSYVDLENPRNSLLLLKVKGEQPTNCGGDMPPIGSPALTAAQLTCLEDWIGSL
jgi:hypothetical protein